MQTYGLLGKNVGYSLSPAMHNAAFKSSGLDCEYKLFDVSADKLGDFFAALRKGDISGCNVTIPYKEEVLGLVDTSSVAAKQIGASNTIIKVGGKLKGYNTDCQGFMKAIRGHGEGDLDFSPEGKTAFLFGAGGAARAVVYSLLVLGIKKILITDIDTEKAEGLAGSVVEKQEQNVLITVIEDKAQYNELISKSDLLVNATPCGMKEDDKPLFDYSYIHEKLFVFDLIYTRNTALMKEAVCRGARAVNGLNMLLYQAAEAFTLWTGKKAPIPIMKQALLGRTGK